MEFKINNDDALRKLIKRTYFLGKPTKDGALSVSAIILKNEINKLVPKKSGALRKSASITLSQNRADLSWGENLPYTHYQYVGKIYTPNKPIMNNRREVIGWVSPETPKKPSRRWFRPYNTPIKTTTGRGRHKQRIFLCMGGYTTKDTTALWVDRFQQRKRNYNAVMKRIKNIFKTVIKEGYKG